MFVEGVARSIEEGVCADEGESEDEDAGEGPGEDFEERRMKHAARVLLWGWLALGRVWRWCWTEKDGGVGVECGPFLPCGASELVIFEGNTGGGLGEHLSVDAKPHFSVDETGCLQLKRLSGLSGEDADAIRAIAVGNGEWSGVAGIMHDV